MSYIGCHITKKYGILNGLKALTEIGGSACQIQIKSVDINFIEKDSIDTQDIKEIILLTIGGNPRAIKRLVNSVSLIQIFTKHKNKLLNSNSEKENAKDVRDKKFLLLCGFENFKDYYVRIDILEKLFLKIIEKTKDRKFKIDADMINLIGCTKDIFYKLIILMNYKKGKEIDIYHFRGDKRKKVENFKKIKNEKENPFNKLLNLNIK